MRPRTIKKLFLIACLLLVSFSAEASLFERKGQVVVRVFYLPTCRACHKVMEDIIPSLQKKYRDRVRWEYIDASIEADYKKFVSLEKQAGRSLGTPALVIGKNILVGVTETADSLDRLIAGELARDGTQDFVLDESGVDLLERFKSFGPWAIVGAGLVDGFNPCAFTVIIFFISFLTLMGYKRREMALIGSAYILAVFLTYLALGLGLFKIFYTLKGFYLVSKSIYFVIGALSIYLAYLAFKDYIIYKKTGNTDAMALQLPRVIKNKIHKVVGDYYRRDHKSRKKALLGLGSSALVVGFLISLLEAVCTGQLYLPTIVFVLKEGSLRARALFYLIVYNIMFILPLVLVLIAALAGVSSKQFEGYARKHLGLIKISMAAVFLALGLVLWMGI